MNRSEHLELLRRRLQRGTYHCDERAIAEAMLRAPVRLLLTAPATPASAVRELLAA